MDRTGKVPPIPDVAFWKACPRLRNGSLYPDGDINAYLPTGGDVNDSEYGSAGGQEEAH